MDLDLVSARIADIRPRQPALLADQLGGALARIHATPLDGLAGLESVFDRPGGSASANRGPAAAVLTADWAFLASAPAVLTHHDFWSGNVLWQGGALTGVVDWPGAAVGPRGFDVGWCRLYWNCKRAPLVAEEAIECVGGNGYIEEHPLPRYYREAPLNAIWEGTSNMMVLDVQRVLTRERKAIEPLLDELRAAASAEPRLGQAIAGIENMISTPDQAGRRLVIDIALAVQAALLVEHAPPAVADAFCASRLDHNWAPTFGTLPARADVAAIIEYARLRTS